MKHKILITFFTFFLTLSFGSVEQILAQFHQCEMYGNFEVVFVGKFIKRELINNPSEVIFENTFEVVEEFYGIETGRLVVTQAFFSIDMINYQKDEDYLIYGNWGKSTNLPNANPRTLYIHGMSILQTSKDLIFLRNLPKTDIGFKVYGNIEEDISTKKNDLALKSLISNIPILFKEQKTKKVYKSRTDSNGRYEITLPKNQEYRIEPIFKKPIFDKLNVSVSKIPKVKTKNGGCSDNSFYITNSSVIGGKFVTTLNLPIKNAFVYLIPENQTNSNDFDFQQTDEFGNFLFENFPIGNYFLVVNYFDEVDDKYPKFYYPNVFDKDKSQIIKLGLGQKITNLKLQLPKPN